MNMITNTGRTRREQLQKYLVIAASFILVLSAYAGYRTYVIYQSELPSFEQLHNIEPNLKTKIYDRNGNLIQEFYSENRVLTPYKEIPPELIQMLLSAEDRQFYNHWGMNLRRVAIVAVTNILKWRIEGGASTITQQLSRMLFLTREQSLDRKIKEALTAIKLERTYSKDEIIEMYLNQYYFSRGAYGVSAAAKLFFSKEVNQLNINDCAILIGLLKGPNINSPLNNPDKSLQARNRVLYSYYEVGGITKEEYDSLKSQPLEINPAVEKVGTAPYFTETIRQYIKEKYGEGILYQGGLKVYTSLDMKLQNAAEAAIAKKIDSLRLRIEGRYSLNHPSYTTYLPDTVDEFGNKIPAQKKVQGAFVAINNVDGDVLAMVGGRSFEETKFNRAVQALRQPGSTFKPIVYTACIDNGFHTTDIIDDNPIVLDIPGAKQWRPHNYDDKFMGPITLRDGLRLSRNLVAIRLLLKMMPEQVIFYARRMGITSPLEAVPSLAVGVSEVKLIELVSAFSVYPNQGIHTPYRMVHKIVDRYGTVLEDNTSVDKQEVLSAPTSYVMVDLMKSVVDAGTGRRARWMGFTRPAGGKTGTSDNFCDNWFVGYTPQITAGVWVGFDDKTSLGASQDGAQNAVPVWTEFMINAHDSLPVVDFPVPDGIVRKIVCIESGEIATDRCLDVRDEVFIAGSEPEKTCRLHPSSGLYVPRGVDLVEPEFEDSSAEREHF
jgi:penicillin-binding protein 1A